MSEDMFITEASDFWALEDKICKNEDLNAYEKILEFNKYQYDKNLISLLENAYQKLFEAWKKCTRQKISRYCFGKIKFRKNIN